MANQAIVGTLRALLTADTGEFETALSRAAASAEKAADRLTKSFQGEKLFKDATAIVAAVEKIGGASKLTAQEAERLASRLNEAIVKAQAMGKSVPDAFRSTHTELTKVASGVNNANAGISAIGGSLRNVAAAMGVAFSAAAVVNFGRKVFDTASQIADMSQKLGVSVEWLQRVKFAAEQSGASFEDVDKAIGFMNKTLSNGETGTKDILRKLGLEFESIRRMKPEDAFLTIAEAIRATHDPTLQAEAITKSWGRSALTLLPAVQDGIKKVGDQTSVMSNETVKRLKEAQDAWAHFFNELTIGSAEIFSGQAFKKMWSDWSTVVRGAIAQAKGEHDEFVRSLVQGQRDRARIAEIDSRVEEGRRRANNEAAIAIDKRIEAEKRYAEEAKRAAAAARQLTEESERFNLSLRVRQDKLIETEAVKKIKEAEEAYNDAAKAAARLTEESEEWARSLSMGHDKLIEKLALAAMKEAEEAAEKLKKAQEKAAKDVAEIWEKAFTKLPDVIIGAIQGGGNVGAAVGGLFGGAIGERLQPILTKQFTSLFGKTIGKALGDAIPGIGAFLGSFVGKLFDKIAQAFRGKGAKANDIRDAIKEAIGGDAAGKGLEKLVTEAFDKAGRGSPLANALDKAFTRFLRAGSPEEVKRAGEELKRLLEQINSQAEKAARSMGDLTDALAPFGNRVPAALRGTVEQLLAMGGVTGDVRTQLERMLSEPDWRDVEAAAQRLGIEIKHLGFGFQQARISDIALQMARDLELVGSVMGGIVSDDALRNAAKGLIDLGKQALETGAALPNTLRPFFERLRDMGALVDENGEALIDFGSLQFSDIVDDQLTRIADILEELLNLFKGLPDAAGKAASGINDAFSRIRPPAFRSPDVDTGTREVPSFDVGTGGNYTRSGGFAMFHADEAVVPRSSVPNLANDLAAALKTVGGGNEFAVGPVFLDSDKIGKVLVYKVKRNDAKGDPKGLKARWREALDLT